ncbi:MAG: hypothetical protein IT361_07725 [Gemmatimonadaceae bacterium]|nr:hypothetical protein [Gemmatimonadaceae bacterium]
MTFRVIVAGLTALSLAGSADAQGARQAALGRAEARLPEPLSLVTTVRELASGQLVVADPIERKLMIVDASLRTNRALGREGSGPGEYRQPDGVWAFPGDSTLVMDLGNARLSVIAPDGRYVRSMPLSVPGGDGPPMAMFPGGTDARGNIYFAPPRMSMRVDTGDVMRADSKGTAALSVARIKTPDVDRQESGSENARQVQIRPIPLAASDGWAVNAEGEVVVLRTGDYHAEWLGATRRVGAPVRVARATIGDAEKREWVNQQMLSGGISMQVEDNNGQRIVSFGRARPTREPNTSGYRWPATKPPFDPASLRVDGASRVWVRRHRPAGEPVWYDVFGRDGNLVGSVTFPARRTLVGFGARHLYAVEIDGDGQYTIERYALPL